MVVVPGSEGDFGVLEAHTDLISSLRPGVVDIYEGDAVSKKLFVTGGFAEVTKDRCTVLATEAFDLGSCSKPEAQALLEEAQEKLAVCISDKDKSLLTEEIATLEQLVDLCN